MKSLLNLVTAVYKFSLSTEDDEVVVYGPRHIYMIGVLWNDGYS